MLNVEAIPALKDNYIWAIVRGEHCVVVDPGEAAPILSWLAQRKLHLSAILITHHHGDHVGGVPALLRHGRVPVYGPANEAIACVSHPLSDGMQLELPAIGATFEIFEVPGHTLGHIAYYGEGLLFCGDTLFACGCGRLFEGSPAQMHASLQRLAALPGETLVYCTHEYTLDNIAFALSVDPDNAQLHERAALEQAKRAQGLPTLPSTIALEQATNPFLRCHAPALRQAAEAYAQRPLHAEIEILGVVRDMKNHF
ncbi:MAG: hydroxyacylglutathione hydrolase [Hydrogenophilaceae bacterium]|nr:hydroxyacylglutathione hydrolase [Hydrogenophilaceae bacterium]